MTIESQNAQTSQIDPITFSVIMSRLDSIATEMTHAVENTAFTPILSLLRDYSCALYDAQARQVAVVDALPIHTNSMHLVLESIQAAFGEDINEGDVIACNDPYQGNTHVADLVTALPVFWEGEHVFWSVVRGNQLDMGAPNPHSCDGAARNVWQEGLTIPPVKLVDRGVERHDVIAMYLANVRWPDLLRGDLMAQIGAIRVGGRRLREMCELYGSDTLRRFVEDAFAYARARTEAEIATWPNGRYEAEGWLDTDGSLATDLLVRCAVTIEDRSVHVDFSGSDPAGAHGMNSSYGTLQAAGGVPIVMAIDPDIPHNHGCLSVVTVTAPEGSVCNASYPSSTAEATSMPCDVMQDVVCKALAQAIPDRVRSGSSRWSGTPMFSGVEPESGVFWGHEILNGGGGGPAADGTDGWPVIISMAAHGGLKFASVEHTELLYPLAFEHWEIEPDSMGAGEFIGGPGVRCVVRPLHGDVEMCYTSDGLVNPPFGLGGGTPGAGGGGYVEDGETGVRRFIHCPLEPVTLALGDTWTGVSSGGGGWGDPLDRPIERVLADVHDGVFSAAVARTAFGVVVDADGALDESATERARATLRAAARGGRDAVLPIEPRASTWYADTMRPGDRFVAPMGWITDGPLPETRNEWAAEISSPPTP